MEIYEFCKERGGSNGCFKGRRKLWVMNTKEFSEWAERLGLSEEAKKLNELEIHLQHDELVVNRMLVENSVV